MSVNWNSSVLWGIIGLVGGGITSFIFFTLSNKTKRIIYQIKSNPLISDKLSQIKGLRITFDSNDIPNLISSTVFIINNGTDIIEPKDFALISPLGIKTDGKFLIYDDVKSFVTKVSNETSNTSLKSIAADSIRLDFDYWGKNDSVLLTILHTGKIGLTGTLKKGKIIESNVYNKKNRFINIIGSILVIMFCLLLLLTRGLEGSIDIFISVSLNMILGFFFINYALQKYRELDILKGISIDGQNLEYITIVSGNQNTLLNQENKNK